MCRPTFLSIYDNFCHLAMQQHATSPVFGQFTLGTLPACSSVRKIDQSRGRHGHMYTILKIADYWRVLKDRKLVSTHITKAEALKAMRAAITDHERATACQMIVAD